jgi:hypothetical protein
MKHGFRIHGDLKDVPDHLVYRMVDVQKSLVDVCKVPYHSVSVVYRPQNLGTIIIFSSDMKDKLTSEIRQVIKNSGFKHIFTFN